MGRKPIHANAMSNAERQARHAALERLKTPLERALRLPAAEAYRPEELEILAAIRQAEESLARETARLNGLLRLRFLAVQTDPQMPAETRLAAGRVIDVLEAGHRVTVRGY